MIPAAGRLTLTQNIFATFLLDGLTLWVKNSGFIEVTGNGLSDLIRQSTQPVRREPFPRWNSAPSSVVA